ncbi:VOC family protein [Allorhodopirellula solitaria]|uniref:3-demethylubiquinone-9 3-methyltransferase n=1 Tax=Allorhodopirellula solitaria TaxID=2527987 RepID=A0A5C5YJQ2_9BACT|nr:VOC family protein [Allorhodopirellula solitaria]TWT75121.1 3-demethylubiquinone-9 3-methyltransferase [Allorhodopirellula solitaria]
MHFKNKITPFLGFQSEAEEAVNFYVSVLPDSRILKTVRNPDSGAVMTVEFELAGMTFVALNSGQRWEFTEAFSLAIACESQEEIDDLWGKLLDGGETLACGWLKDKFGVRWQIVPSTIGQMIGDSDPVRAKRVFDAMCEMIKLDVAKLQDAYDG